MQENDKKLMEQLFKWYSSHEQRIRSSAIKRGIAHRKQSCELNQTEQQNASLRRKNLSPHRAATHIQETTRSKRSY